MKAMTQYNYGGPDLLSFEDVDRPDYGDNEVLVRVKAAAVSPGDRAMFTGVPYINRVAVRALRRPKASIPGFDVAGVVEAIGRSITRFRVGDEVFGNAPGSFAEYAVAAEDELIAKPASWSFEEAAAVPESAGVALQAVRDQAALQAGQRVAIIGAGGGVGSYATQIAKTVGGHVTAVCGPRKVERVREIGADDVIDYTQHDVARTEALFDVIIDTAGKTPLRELRQALTPDGRLVIVGADHSHRVTGGLGRWLRAMVWSLFVRQRLGPFVANPLTLDDLAHIAQLMSDGELVPVVDRTFPFGEAADAMGYLDERTGVGKVVVVM